MNTINRAVSYIGGLFSTGQSQQQTPESARTARLTDAARSLQYFDGHAPKALKIKGGEVDDNIFVNYAETIVSKGVAFLFGQPLKISVGADKDSSGVDYLNKVWPETARDEDLTDMATDGATSGDAWLKIVISPDGSPRIIVGDPHCYSAECDQHDVTRVLKFVCEYPMNDPLVAGGKQFIYREETARADDNKSWRIREFHSYDGGKTFLPTGSDVTWNFAFPPVYHCKNLPKSKSFYGRADLRPDVLRVVDAISRLDSLSSKIVRIHASPKPYARGLKKTDLEWGQDNMLFLGNGLNGVAAEIGLLEMRGDLSGALSLRKVLREGLAEMTKVPEVATGKLESTGQLSGVALRIMYGPLLDQTAVKQRLYGKLIKDVTLALMAIGNISGDGVTLHWADPLPVDEKAQIDAAEGRKRLGVSVKTLLSELGYDAEKEAEQKQTEAQEVGFSLLGAFDKGQLNGGVA